MAITSGGGATVSDGSSGWVSPGNGTAVQPQSHVCPSCGYCDHCGRRDTWRPAPYPIPNPYPWWGVYPSYYVGDPPPTFYYGWPTYTTITCGGNSQMSVDSSVSHSVYV